MPRLSPTLKSLVSKIFESFVFVLINISKNSFCSDPFISSRFLKCLFGIIIKFPSIYGYLFTITRQYFPERLLQIWLFIFNKSQNWHFLTVPIFFLYVNLLGSYTFIKLKRLWFFVYYTHSPLKNQTAPPFSLLIIDVVVYLLDIGSSRIITSPPFSLTICCCSGRSPS